MPHARTQPLTAVVAAAVAALVSTGCTDRAGCTGEFTVDMAADTPGAPTPQAALDAWLDGTSPVGAAPEGAPTAGWEETPGGPDTVQLEHGDWSVTAFRTTNDEWIVTTLVCG